MTIPDYKILTNGSRYVIQKSGEEYYDYMSFGKPSFTGRPENYSCAKYLFKWMAVYRVSRRISYDIKQQQIAQLNKKPWVET